MARSTRLRVADRTLSDPFTTRETVIGDTVARRATSAMVTVRPVESVVQHRLDLGIVDVGLVVVVEAGVDILRQRLTLDGFDRGIDALVTDADGVLGDGTLHETTANRVGLGLARVVADDGDLAGLIQLLYRVDDANCRAFIGTEEALE